MHVPEREAALLGALSQASEAADALKSLTSEDWPDNFQKQIDYVSGEIARGRANIEYLISLYCLLVADDPEKAHGWMAKAAMHGLTKAMLGMAVFYENAIGCQFDPAKRDEWYSRATVGAYPAKAVTGEEKPAGPGHAASAA